MPRPKTNTVQVTFRVPSPWLARSDALAPTLCVPGILVTRTDVLRAAMERGLTELEHIAGERVALRRVK